MDRRLYCRLAFVLLCLVPTLATGGAITWRRTSEAYVGSPRSWEARLSQISGFRVSLGGVSRPESGTLLFEQVLLSDRETARPIARARLVEATKSERGLFLAISQPEIEVEEFERLAGVLHETLLRDLAAESGPLVATASELTLRSAAEAQTFTSVECLLEHQDAGPLATIRFRLPQSKGSERAELRVARLDAAPRPVTKWEFQTGSEPMPCAVLAAYLPSLAALGRDAQYEGLAWGEETPSGWQGEISGQFRNVDLDELVTARFPQKLSGRANIILNRAVVRGGRLVDAAGLLEARHGAIGRSFLLAASEALGLEAAERVERLERSPLRYERLSIGFEIGLEGLALSGDADSQDALIVDREGALLSAGAKGPAPVVSLVRALSPASSVQVPATLETDALLRVLPVPPFTGSGQEPKHAPEAAVRLSPEPAGPKR